MTPITLTFDQWQAQFEPLENILTDNAPCDGCMYETFGTELDAIQKADADKVWTLTECDGELFIQNGFHIVNRLGYFLTKNPHDPAGTYQVDYSELEHDTVTITIKTHTGLDAADKELLADKLQTVLDKFGDELEAAGTSISGFDVAINPAQPFNSGVTVRLEGGLVQGAFYDDGTSGFGTPCRVGVRDYDTEGADENDLATDAEGNSYFAGWA